MERPAVYLSILTQLLFQDAARRGAFRPKFETPSEPPTPD